MRMFSHDYYIFSFNLKCIKMGNKVVQKDMEKLKSENKMKNSVNDLVEKASNILSILSK
jgi:hypothetical protein